LVAVGGRARKARGQSRRHALGESLDAHAERAEADAMPARRSQEGAAALRLFHHCSFGKLESSVSTVSSADLASRRSPVPRARRLNQTTRPSRKSTSDA